ncbi:uncharacterized protein LOC123474456 [Daphnia magna]|uniref:uncharacterized protein LOC123474456 n=1 Tax=Daphnia magna TaxID=35525 RepID=UPI001E1BC492|nr:uncharacterized protein LOC123474456 [Daphnia magna]
MTSRLKIASINIGGITSVERRQILLNFCRDGNLDIVGLQEVAFHSCPIIESCYHLLANVGPNKNGTAILIKHGLEYSRLLLEPDGRLISIDVKCFTFINIYAPSGKQAKNERNTFLRQTVPAYSVTARLPFVLMGDFNCVDDIQDRANTHDHQSVQTTLTCNLDHPNRSRSSAGLWKLNTLIFSEEGYQKYVTNFIQESANHPLRESNVANWWESVLKPGIKRISVDYSRQRARLIRQTKFSYQSCIQELAEADTFDWVAFHQLRKFSKSWEKSTLKGYGIRSRCFEGPELEEARNLQFYFTTLAAYLFITWKERSHLRFPRQEEVESLWKALRQPISLCPT